MSSMPKLTSHEIQTYLIFREALPLRSVAIIKSYFVSMPEVAKHLRKVAGNSLSEKFNYYHHKIRVKH